MKIIIQILNASYCTNLKNVDHDKVLKVILSYPITFSRKGKLYRDISSAYRRNRKFGVGLLPFIKEKLDKYEEDFEIQDLTNTKLLKIKSTKDVKLFEKTLENYQMSAINILDKGINRGIIQSPTGCLTGDTIIRLNRASKGFKTTLQNLYKKFNGLDCKGKRWNLAIPTKVRSFNKKLIQLNNIENVTFSGIKNVYRLILENGFSIKGTFDHKIKTKNGWKELGKLKITDFVMCDNIYSQKSKNPLKKHTYSTMIRNLKFHPYATIVHIKRENIKIKQIEIHRAIYEANINSLTLNNYINILQTSRMNSKKLTYINPSIYDIHHIDLNHYNNDPENLIHMTKYDHQNLHGQTNYKNFNQGIPIFSKVKAVIPLGKERTYDIQCQDPYHNFVANGIVVHNSGKTSIAAALIEKLNRPNTLFIAPTKEIARSSAKSFETDLQTNIGFIGDQVKVIEPITVCLYQSLRNIVNNNPKILKQLIESVSLILVDEAHLASKAIEDCLSPFTNTYYRFGLTATPKQAYKKDIYFQITGQLGPVIHKITEEQAKERVITNVKVLMWNFFGKITEKKYMDIYRKNVLLNNTRCRLLLEMVEYSFHKENRFNCLLLVDEYEQALLIKKLSTKHHVPKPIIVWSGMSTKESDEIKEKLNNGTIEFVIATPKWSVGADIPEIETVIIGSARKSIANLTQKIGRGKRKRKGKEDLLVMDTFDKIGKYDKFFIEYSEIRKKFYERKGWLKGVLDGEYSTE